MFTGSASFSLIRRWFQTVPGSLRRRAPLRPSNAPTERTYREELYSGRRIDLREGLPVHVGLRRLSSVMHSGGIIKTLRAKREFTRPGLVKSLARMEARHQRFDEMVRNTLNEIKDIYRRLK
jgi:hypothetical protein